MATSLRKPATIGATANPPTSGSIIYGSSGATFVIKIWRMVFEHGPHDTAEVTGDGDAVQRIEHNGLQRGHYTFYGACVDAVAIGLANLSGSSNPGAVKFKLSSGSGAGVFHNVTLMVTSIRGDWQHTGVYVPLVIQAVVTDTTASAIEATS